MRRRLPDARTRRARHRRRRRGTEGGDRGVGGRRLGRPRLQVAAGQGAHGDGRRRHRRRARQRRRPRQLEGPFRRHDARRPVREQLAHGGAAREGSARPRPRARGVGRGVRSHQGRTHPAAQLRRPPLSAPGARRRPHRPRDDPHAAGSRHPPGHRRAHGVHDRHAAQGRRPRRRRVRLRARARTLQAVSREGGRAGDRRRRPRLQDHEQQLGIHRRRPHARLRRRRRADGHGVRAVPSDRHDLAAERSRHSRHRGGARRRRRPQEQRGPPLHVRRHPRELPGADGGQRRRGLALHAGRQGGAAAAGAADARSREPLHHARGQGRPRQPARRRLPRHRVDQGADRRTAPSTSRRSCRACTTSSSSSPTSTSPQEPMEVGPTTHYIMGGVRVDARHADVDRAGPVRRGRVRRRHQRRESARRQLALRHHRVRQARRRVRREVREDADRARAIDARQVDEAARRALEPFERGAPGRRARIRCSTRCRR